MEFLVWDAGASQKIPLSVCSLPIEHSFKGALAGFRSCYYILEMVGNVMQCSGNCVKALIFDAATSHSFVRKAMHGQLDDMAVPGEYSELPWFSKLTYTPLPESCLPRVPIQLSFFENEIVWGIPGVCDLAWFPNVFHIFIYLYICSIWKCLDYCILLQSL